VIACKFALSTCLGFRVKGLASDGSLCDSVQICSCHQSREPGGAQCCGFGHRDLDETEFERPSTHCGFVHRDVDACRYVGFMAGCVGVLGFNGLRECIEAGGHVTL
jgi:hypothetical protein